LRWLHDLEFHVKYMLATGGSEEAAAADAWRHHQL
jgi:hypothetical protein